MKVNLSGESQYFDMFQMGDEELFRYVDNHPNPELMGGKLADAFKKGTKKIKAKVQKVVKKAATKYKALPKWAKVVTGVLGAPAVLGLAPAAIGAVAPVAMPALSIAKTTALTALPAAIPALQAKKIAQAAEKRRKAQKAAQAKAAVEAAAVVPVSQPVQQAYTAPEPVQTYQQPAYSQPVYDDYEEQQQVTSSNIQPEKKGIPGWLLGAAALLPFFL